MRINQRWLAGVTAGLCLSSFSMAYADDPPAKPQTKPETKQEEKPKEKPKDAKAEFAAIQKESRKAQGEFFGKLNEIKDQKEARKKYTEEFPEVMQPFYDRVLAMEKDFPDAAETTQAMIWASSESQKQDFRKKVMEIVKARLAKAEVKDLPGILGNPNPAAGEIGKLLFDRVKTLDPSPDVEKVVVWAAMSTVYGGPNDIAETYNKSIEKLVDQYPKSQSFLQLAGLLSQDDNPKWAKEQFQKLIDKNKDGDNGLIGKFGLAMMSANDTDKEKEVLASLESFVKDAKEKQNLSSLVSMANGKIKDLKLINNPIPEISGEDLDGKEFKISDYKGKVVLLDFWGFW